MFMNNLGIKNSEAFFGRNFSVNRTFEEKVTFRNRISRATSTDFCNFDNL
jgi:hypothetical protein